MADFLQQGEVIWFLIGLVLILMELAVPGLVLVFFGVGAWLTALCCLIFSPGLNTQLFIFLAGSSISLALLRRMVKRRYMDRQPETVLEDDYIGQVAVALTSFNAGDIGKVMFKGSHWEATAQTAITAGQRLRITGYKSIKLFVEPLQ